jgi:hypothetical protein
VGARAGKSWLPLLAQELNEKHLLEVRSLEKRVSQIEELLSNF